MYRRPVLKNDMTKTLLRMKRASLDTEAHLIRRVIAIIRILVQKLANVMKAPKDLAAK